MATTNATEFQKRVGEFSDIARREPVTVTRHGRASLVLISVEDYQRLKQIEERATQAAGVRDLSDNAIAAMMAADLSHMPPDHAPAQRRWSQRGRRSLMVDLVTKSDSEIDTWIANHEKKRVTDSDLYRLLLEERSRRHSKLLSIETSLRHLVEAARAGRFTTYGDVAKANDVPWSKARHAMNGSHEHLDRLLDVCHARDLPLLTAICVNQKGEQTGKLAEDALSGFIKGAQRLGYSVTDGASFLRARQQECFEWGKAQDNAAI